jgi:hypothetical protein
VCERENERERDRECLKLCLCVCERERCVFVCVREREHARVRERIVLNYSLITSSHYLSKETLRNKRDLKEQKRPTAYSEGAKETQ